MFSDSWFRPEILLENLGLGRDFTDGTLAYEDEIEEFAHRNINQHQKTCTNKVYLNKCITCFIGTTPSISSAPSP